MVVGNPPPKSATAARIFQEISKQVKEVTGPVLEDIRDVGERRALEGRIADLENVVEDSYALLRLLGALQIATLAFVLGMYL